MQIYFHRHLCSYLSRVPILVEGTVYAVYQCFPQTLTLFAVEPPPGNLLEFITLLR